MHTVEHPSQEGLSSQSAWFQQWKERGWNRRRP